MKILGIIPARYGSTRFPAKALADINGKSMVQRVYEQTCKCNYLNDVVVATDHVEIQQEVQSFGGKVCMTKANHQSGTDRCYEALLQQPESYDYVVNVQGDEPYIDPEQISTLAKLLDGHTQLGTLIKPINNNEDIFNPNVVKAVANISHEAIYFSRNPSPYLRNVDKSEWHNHHIYFKHIGIYAYRTDILKQITSLSISLLEKAESLEQLRWIENGYKIMTAVTHIESKGIDTPEDLENLLNSNIIK